MGDILLTSVPARDLPLAAQVLPEAIVTTRPLSAELAEAHPDVEVLSVMVHDPVAPEVLAKWPDLRGLVTRSTGHDHLPMSWLQDQGLLVCHLGAYAVDSVVQHTVMLVLMLLRRAPEAMQTTQGSARAAHGRPRWERGHLVGRNLRDVQVGVLGTGRIGGGVARTFAAMGAQVRGFDLVEDERLRQVPGFRYVRPWSTFLAGCDVLSVHVPLTAETRHMVDRAALARLPPGAFLVNTARGRVVDQLAVERALRSGRLGGYAADVLPGEPDPPHLSRFQDITNAILTPHLGAFDQRAIRARYAHTARVAVAIQEGDLDSLADHRIT